MSFSSLHNHTEFSLLDGYGHPEEYLMQAKKLGLKAFAVTEHGNEYSWCYFDKLKEKYPEVKMIYGVEFYECFDMSIKDKESKYFHLIVLAKNETGRKALNKLVTVSNFEGFYYRPRISIDKFIPYAKNLVVLSACLASKIAREPDYDKCIEYIKEYKSIFPHFYLEMQSHKHSDQEQYNQKILRLANDTGTPFVITTDSHAATKEDLRYQAKHVQIAHDSDTASEIYEGCYMQSEDEIHQTMDKQIGTENVIKGLETSNEIADLIENVNMPFQAPTLPTFKLPKGFDDNYNYLKYLVNEGWSKRGWNEFDKAKQAKYRKRLDYEMGIIHQMGFDGYFLIVWDFINYARSQNVMVAPGRGSCAGSLVCYALHITDLDPIKYGLIFERFLNPERVSMPDTDTDVSDRKKVIDYLVEKYGADNVCQIINFSYITPTVAIKDVGKVLGFQYADMDKLSKRFVYPTFQECLKNNEDFVSSHPQYVELFDIAGHLSGRVKTVSCHAGGVGIVDTSINDYMAMKLGEKGEHIIQVDKRIVEEIGIIKFDILGVQTLSMIKEIQNDLHMDEYQMNINNPDFEYDTEPYKLLAAAKTNGIFQVESAGMKDLLLRLKANSLEDLSAILALYRPDSMGALEDYIARKNGVTQTEYVHPDMEPILKDTYGCMIYQEQLMNIVRKFGGRTMGGADKFRKGIGKKDKKLVQQESEKLYNEICNNGYTEEIAKYISEDMKSKGSYLFNRSHSFSYAVICFQTAWLKTHYPLYFFKALFNLNKDKQGMLNKYILDAREFNIEVVCPNINKSDMNFKVDNNKVLFGLSAIKGIGETFAQVIINERENNGTYKSLQDFIERVNPTKTQIISLIKSGAIPAKDKKNMLIKYFVQVYDKRKFKPVNTVPSPYSKLEQFGLNVENYRDGKKVDKERLLADLNKAKEQMFNIEEENRFNKYKNECAEKYMQNELFWEFEALQIFLKNNPFDAAYNYLTPFEDIDNGVDCTIVGVISKVQKKKDRNGKQFAFVNIYSSFGLIEGIVWHSTYKEYQDLITNNSQLAILAKKDSDERVIVKKIKPYQTWLNQKRKAGVKI